jgi:hypothetical protein
MFFDTKGQDDDALSTGDVIRVNDDGEEEFSDMQSAMRYESEDGSIIRGD